MKSKFHKLLITLIGLIVLYNLGSCMTTSEPTSVNLISTKLVSPSSTPSVPLTSTPTPTQLQPTAISTLQLEDASTEILRLLLEDNACTFPCWWGLIPGKTRINDTKNFLNSFHVLSGQALQFKKNNGYMFIGLPQEQNSYLEIYIEFEGEADVLKWLQVSIQRKIKVINFSGEVSYETSWEDPKLAEITKPFSLSHVLLTYGSPSQVFLYTNQTALLKRPWPISLVVFYPEQGFLIEYIADSNTVIKNSGVTWCPSFAFPSFGFWSPSEEITLNKISPFINSQQQEYGGVDWGRFKTIDEAAGMSIEEFYSTFMNDEETCITTPAEIWPMPGQ